MFETSSYNNNNNNNNNTITSMALKSSESRAQKRNKTKSVIIFKSRGPYRDHPADYLRWKSNFEEISFEMFTERGKTFTRCQCGWEFIPNDGCSNRESTLAQVQFSSGNRKLL